MYTITLQNKMAKNDFRYLGNYPDFESAVTHIRLHAQKLFDELFDTGAYIPNTIKYNENKSRACIYCGNCLVYDLIIVKR